MISICSTLVTPFVHVFCRHDRNVEVHLDIDKVLLFKLSFKRDSVERERKEVEHVKKGTHTEKEKERGKGNT